MIRFFSSPSITSLIATFILCSSSSEHLLTVVKASEIAELHNQNEQDYDDKTLIQEQNRWVTNHPNEGQAVKCNSSSHAVYRFTNGQIRLYPSSAIATSWDSNWRRFKVIDCTGIQSGPSMMYNVDLLGEGRAVKCNSSSRAVYRYTNGKIRRYPSRAIATSWDPNWHRYKVIDCTSIAKGARMPYKN